MRLINFYLMRLRHASVAELLYRLRQALLEYQIRVRLSWDGAIHTPPLHAGAPDTLQLPEIEGQLNSNEDNPTHILGTSYQMIAAFERGYRNTKVCTSPDSTDIRAVWEPARLQYITRMLRRSLMQPEAFQGNGAKEIIKNQVLRWLEVNPFLKGPHYILAMECALRIPVFIACLKHLDNLSSTEFNHLVAAVYSHAWWTASRLSLYSSLGNHTIAEAMGLIHAGAFFRHMPEGQKWLATGKALLDQELHHQILPDGGGAEQSIAYHRFVLDLYALSCDLLEGNSLGDYTTMRRHLACGESFLRAFSVGNSYLAIGDSDDGHAVAPGLHPRRPAVHKEQSDLEIFPDTGYSVVHAWNGCHLIFDHGPLGMPPLYNHGHADALSLWLIRENQVLLGDSGTYRYNGASTERAYFKGTRAHNTVCIDGLDQASQVTSFIWSNPYQIHDVTQSRYSGGILLSASHDGYDRLQQPVRHNRQIFWDQSNFIISDSFSGMGKHSFELNFHVDPHAEIVYEDGWWRVERENATVSIRTMIGDTFRMIRGQTTPLLGWHSPAYGEKEPCSVLQSLKYGFPEMVSFITIIATEGLPSMDDIRRKIVSL